jgi:phage gp29-like protein
MSRLLGPDGRPISAKELTREVAAPETIGVRNVWADTVSGDLTPDRIARILKDAAQGENREFLGLAEEMEEREGHYGSVLGQRKRAVSGIDPIVKAASDDKKDEEIADAVSEMIGDSKLALAIDDFLDGLGKGYSAVEMQWDYGRTWKPINYVFRDPRFYQFDRLNGLDIRLRENGNREGRPLTQAERYAHVFHVPKLKSGLPVRNGLARFAMWTFALKSYTLQDWMAFLEVFGMPLRIGRYDSNSSHDDRRVLLRAVRDLGTDAAAIIPKSMEIELVEAKGGSSNAVFGAFAEYLDRQTSKIVLGQTMTTDSGSSLSQAKIHNEVRLDIRRADARQLAATLTRDIVIPFVAFNFGPQERYPEIDFPVEEPEDLKEHAEILAKLVPVGLKVQMSEVRDRFGYSTPDEGAEVLTPPAAPAASAPAAPALASQLPLCPHCGTRHLAAAKAEGLSAEDELIAEALSHHERDLEPIVAKILATADAAEDYDDFLAKLQTVTLDTSGLARRLASLQMKARGTGELDQ